MVAFLLAAIATALLWPPPVPRRTIPGLIALFVMGLVLWSHVSGSQNFILVATRGLATAPETLQAMLGALVAALWLRFYSWAVHGTKWQLGMFSAGIGVVVLVALLAPFAPRLLDRMSGIETSYVKIQLATQPAEKHLVLNAEKDLTAFQQLDELLQTQRFIRYECGYAALKAGGMAKFSGTREHQRFVNALTFRARLDSYFVRLVNAQRLGYSNDSLKARVRPVAEKLSRLLVDKKLVNDEGFYKSLWSEIAAQHKALDNERVPKELLKTAAESNTPNLRQDYCGTAGSEEITPAVFLELGEKTRFVAGPTAGLLLFSGDTDGAVRILRLALANENHGQDINLNVSFAEALYFSDRPPAEVSRYYEVALGTVETQAADVQAFVVKHAGEDKHSAADVQIKAHLTERYNRARQHLRLRLAYLWAQAGIRLPTAHRYAQESYDLLRERKRPSFVCLDDAEPFYIQDTYAYARMVVNSRGPQSTRTEAERSQLREAKAILEDTMDQLRAYEGSAAENEKQRLATCFDEARRKLWLVRVASHLRQAENLVR